MKARITEEFAMEIQPERGKLIRVWDSQLPGFGVYVTAAGARSYFISYQIGGKVRRKTIAKVGKGRGCMSAHDARREAARQLREATAGNDPLAAPEAPPKTVAEFWEQFHAERRVRWKPRTEVENLRLWRLYVNPALGPKKLAEVTRADVVAMLHAMRGTPGTANFCLRLVRAMFGHALDAELIDRHPCRRLKPHKLKTRDRALSAEEYRALFEAIAREEAAGGACAVVRHAPTPADEERIAAELVAAGVEVRRRKDGRLDRRHLPEPSPRGISPWTAGLFRLLMLTGCRLREVMDSEWAWVDWEKPALALPDSKTGSKLVPLPRPALAELRRLQQLRTAGAKWVVEGGDGGHLVCAHRAWGRVLARAGEVLDEHRKAAGLDPQEKNPFEGVRLHDLRHSYVSAGFALGLDLTRVGRVVGHASGGGMTGKYAHAAFPSLLATAEEIAGAIAKAGRPEGVG